MQITFESRKRNTRFYILRDVPAKDMIVLNKSSEGYDSFN